MDERASSTVPSSSIERISRRRRMADLQLRPGGGSQRDPIPQRSSERPFVAWPQVLRDVQSIFQIMGVYGAELRRSSVYVLGHGLSFSRLAGGSMEFAGRGCQVAPVGLWRLAGGHGRCTPFEDLVTVFGSTELIRSHFCCAANIAFLRNILYSSFIRCTANNL